MTMNTRDKQTSFKQASFKQTSFVPPAKCTGKWLKAQRRLQRLKAVMRRSLACLKGWRAPALGRVYCQLGRELMAAGRHSHAAAALKSALGTAPHNADFLALAAKAHTLSEDYDFAALLWRGLAERFPRRYGMRQKLQHAKCLRLAGNLQDAKSLYQQIYDERPDQPWGLVGLARVAQKSRQWSLAAKLWQECLLAYPDHAKQEWQDRRVQCVQAAERLPADLETATSKVATAYLQHTKQSNHTPDRNRPELRFKSLLIVTYGRSGSTLLQGLLNSIDGMLIRGENNNVFRHLFALYQTAQGWSQFGTYSQNANSPWYGIGAVDHQQLLGQIQQMARMLVVSDQQDRRDIRCFGFKEIRYPDLGEHLSDYLEFLTLAFPQTAFVFLTRDHDEVANSGWWQDQDPQQVRQTLSDFERRAKDFAQGRADCFQLSYADIVQKTCTLEQMFAFLGAPYEPSVIDLVLATPHSYRPSSEASKKLFRAL